MAKFANQYVIRWFKCKFKPPNNLEHWLAIATESFSPLDLDYTTSLIKVWIKSDMISNAISDCVYLSCALNCAKLTWTTNVILRQKYNVPTWDGKFYCCPATKLNVDASSWAWKLHCYWDILRFETMWAHVVLGSPKMLCIYNNTMEKTKFFHAGMYRPHNYIMTDLSASYSAIHKATDLTVPSCSLGLTGTIPSFHSTGKMSLKPWMGEQSLGAFLLVSFWE